MITIPVSQFKSTCLKLFKKIRDDGKSVLITNNGVPLALVTPPPKPRMQSNGFGSMKSSTIVNGDIVSPVAESDWEVLKT